MDSDGMREARMASPLDFLMEKITIRQTYTQTSLYANFSATGGAKKKDGIPVDAVADDGKSCAHKGKECARSKDGDTFTLSIEARTLQVSRTITIETDDAAQVKSGRPSEEERVGGGFVKALLEEMDKADGKYRKPRHLFAPLSGPEDVAGKMLASLDSDHAAAGGTRLDFADAVKKRLEQWKPSATRVTMEYQEFSSQVKLMMTGGLDAWARKDKDDSKPGNTDSPA